MNTRKTVVRIDRGKAARYVGGMLLSPICICW
jgi:hypothetical protein